MDERPGIVFSALVDAVAADRGTEPLQSHRPLYQGESPEVGPLFWLFGCRVTEDPFSFPSLLLLMVDAAFPD